MSLLQIGSDQFENLEYFLLKLIRIQILNSSFGLDDRNTRILVWTIGRRKVSHGRTQCVQHTIQKQLV